MIDKYLNDDRIIKGLHLPMEMDFVTSQPHKIYDFGDGFVLFVKIDDDILVRLRISQSPFTLSQPK